MKLHRWTVTLSVSEFRSLPLRYPGNKQATALHLHKAFTNNDGHVSDQTRTDKAKLRTRMERSARPERIRPQTSGQSNLTQRLHCRHTWTVQSYSPAGANVHQHLKMCLLGLESTYQMASWLVQPLWHGSQQKVPICSPGHGRSSSWPHHTSVAAAALAASSSASRV